MARGLVDEFGSEQELSRKVTAALTRTIRERFASPEATETLADESDTPGRERLSAARLTASVSRFSSNGRFVVENRGEATAENVTISIEAADDGSKPTIFLPDRPIRYLAPDSAVDFPMAIGFGSSMLWDVVLRWTDPTGEQETRQTVTF